ncbi:M15 family metallopeptidase [Desulfoluna sp.]|uniref:M15 family metallopeptidase n=1 Tax=Desulfoluna sp. TaxID=2045199 RepID=UPI00262E335C|nr:M15 family metallopeptidase [Desulfoluna sp.]
MIKTTTTSKFSRLFYIFPLFVMLLAVSNPSYAESKQVTPDVSVIDARMTENEAFNGLNPKCPEELRKKQKIVQVKYYSYDNRIHEGQVVVDGELEEDIKTVFKQALNEHFVIYSVIPISDKHFRKNNSWDDDLSMEANNTSAFNYRMITGSTTRLSKHAQGRAIDINPFQNPYIKGDTVLPTGSTYDPMVAGTLTADSPIVKTFLRLGWDWGGNWTSYKDYQHFEKPRSNATKK